MKKNFIILLCVFLYACGEKEVDLGAGYKYLQLDGVNHAISNRDNQMVVDPNVTRYKVFGSYVIGERQNTKIDERLSKKFGYFILDMRNGQLVEGLDKAGFENALRALNLDAESF